MLYLTHQPLGGFFFLLSVEGMREPERVPGNPGLQLLDPAKYPDVEEDEEIIEENRSQDNEKRDAQPVPEALYDKAETDEDDDDGLIDEEEDDLDHDFISEDSVDTINSSEEE